MNRSLRKGKTRVYLQHANTGHNIGAKCTESEVKNDLAILRLTLSPIDGNQKSDEGYLHNERLEFASIADERIIDGFIKHVKEGSNKVSAYKLELLSRGKTLEFDVTPEIDKQANLRRMYLTVNNG
jgi:hypothetical protein